MRVVLDGRALGDDSAYRGIGRYLRNLLTALVGRDDIDVTALVRRAVTPPSGVGVRHMWRHAPGRFARREHDLLLPLSLMRTPGDVVHSPAQDPPARCGRPWVQTLHGLVPLVDPSPGFAGERALWERVWGPRMRNADAVIAVSEFCRRQAIDVLHLEPSRIHVAHHGVDDRFRTSTVSEPADPPYVLHVGEWGPTKGHADMAVLARALAERGLPHRVRLVGRVAPWYRAAVQDAVQRSGAADRIDIVGYVDDSLPTVYAQASAVVLPTRYESFCLPAVEAMAAGVPVVAYDNTALPEITGGAAMLVDDGQVDALIAATVRVLTEPAIADELAEAGRQRSLAFDWAHSAAVHADVFRNVLR